MRLLACLTVVSVFAVVTGCGDSGPEKPVIEKNIDQKKSFKDTSQSGKKKEFIDKY